jgi:hypothetical protein
MGMICFDEKTPILLTNNLIGSKIGENSEIVSREIIMYFARCSTDARKINEFRV